MSIRTKSLKFDSLSVDPTTIEGEQWYNVTDKRAKIKANATTENLAYESDITNAFTKDEFTPTTGQVTFILSSAPTSLASVRATVNGVVADDVNDFTVSGTTFTWLNTLFTLDGFDKLIITYV